MSAASGIDCRGYEVDELVTLADEIQARRKVESWSTTDELLAQVIEWLSVMRVESLALGGVKKRDLPEPIHIRRPGEQDKKPTVREAVRSMLGVS